MERRGKMKVQELQNKLIRAITSDEWKGLEHGDSSFVISSFNRDVLLSMKNSLAENFDIDKRSVLDLHEALQKYLNIYMADCPAGHKWIIVASIFLTFVKKRPMHPQQATHWKCFAASDKMKYICPCKDASTGSICSYCVCCDTASS